jgi:hypothetical protein
MEEKVKGTGLVEKTKSISISGTPRQIHRSPNYPYISLKRGIELVRKLFEADKRMKVPVSIAQTRWGLTETSSSGPQVVAALDSYGLIDIEGKQDNKKIGVSNLYLKYHYATSETERHEILVKCALLPPLYAKVWDEFNRQVPQDDLLKRYLVVDLNFNSESVNKFILRFKETIEFAGLLNQTYTGNEDEIIPTPPYPSSTGEPLMEIQTQPTPPNASMASPPIPLGANQWEISFDLPSGPVRLRFPKEMVEGDFAAMESLLDVYLKTFKQKFPKAEAQGN